MNTLTEDELKELARKALKGTDDEHERNERREIVRRVVKYLGVEKIHDTPVKHWPLLQAMFEHWIKTDNPLMTAVAEPEKTVGTLAELNVQPGDEVQLVESEFTNSDQVGEIYLIARDGRVQSKTAPKEYYGYWDSLTSNQGSKWRVISRAAEAERKETVAIPPVFITDKTPLDHFGQAAKDNDGVPQTSKDAYAEIARSLGHAVIAHVEAGDYEQALKCAALMRRAECEPVAGLKVEWKGRLSGHSFLEEALREGYAMRQEMRDLAKHPFSGSAAMSKDDLA